MNKLFINKIKKLLAEERKEIEKELQMLAEKDKKLKEEWHTKFPEFDNEVSSLEEEADEVEEYDTKLSIKQSLENKLKDINLALEKIKKGNYGNCEKCRKKISQEKLLIYPETKTCSKCQR